MILVQGFLSTILFYYSIFLTKDLEIDSQIQRVGNNLFEDLITRNKNQDFVAIGFEQLNNNNNPNHIDKNNGGNYFNNFLKRGEYENADNKAIIKTTHQQYIF